MSSQIYEAISVLKGFFKFETFLLDDTAAAADQEHAAHPGDGGRAAVRGKGPTLEMLVIR